DRYGVILLYLSFRGEYSCDTHDTVDACVIAVCQSFSAALADKRGIRLYGACFDPRNPFTGEAYLPMDECLARCVIDFSGRPYLVWRGLDDLAPKKITAAERNQDMSSAFRFGLAKEFFQAFANEARCNLHLELVYGSEPHHVVEALFKAFAKATDFACQRDARIARQVPSTKGRL